MKKKRLDRYLIFSNIVFAILLILYILALWVLNLKWEALGENSLIILSILGSISAVLIIYILASNLISLIYLIAKREKALYLRAIVLLVISTIVIFTKPISGLIGTIFNLGTSGHDPLQTLDFGILLLVSLYYWWKE